MYVTPAFQTLFIRPTGPSFLSIERRTIGRDVCRYDLCHISFDKWDIYVFLAISLTDPFPYVNSLG
jgi:hypothetical protein